MGRFINRDDFHGFEDEPASLNQYAYANGNPVMNIDPTGHWTQTAGTIARGVATVGRVAATGVVVGASALLTPEVLVGVGLVAGAYAIGHGVKKGVVYFADKGQKQNLYEGEIDRKYGRNAKVLQDAYANARKAKNFKEAEKIKRFQKWLKQRQSSQKSK